MVFKIPSLSLAAKNAAKRLKTLKSITIDKNKYLTIRDKLQNSGLSLKQATVLERAFANIKNFNEDYWFNEFKNNEFTIEQAKCIVEMFIRMHQND